MSNGNDPAVQFAKAIKNAGLELNGLPVMDGLLHRLPVASDKGSERSGAYVGHLEGRVPGGYIQNFKTGEKINWKADGAAPELTPAERARFAIEAARARKERDAAKSAEHEATSAAARALWNESWIAKNTNPYCVAKNIIDPVGLRTVPSNMTPHCAALGIKIVKNTAEAKAAREADPKARVFKTGDLLVPGLDAEGKLWTLQSINPYFKSLMKGGKKHGMFTVAGTDNPNRAMWGLGPLVIAEGFATASTVSRLLNQPVIAAFDSGNLDAVAQEMRKRFPSRAILIAADNDHEAPLKMDQFGKPMPNVGLVSANAAAVKYGCGVMAPPFEPGDKGSDWNDLAAIKGDAVAKRIIGDSMIGAKLEADGNLATIKANKTINAEKGVLATLKKTVATEFVRHFKPRELNKQHVPTRNPSQERGGFEI